MGSNTKSKNTDVLLSVSCLLLKNNKDIEKEKYTLKKAGLFV